MERGDINLDWIKNNNYFTTNANTNAWATVEGFGSKFETHNTWVEFDDDSIIDVTDSYKELETISSICNRCEHQHLAIRINDKTQQTLCDAWDYKKPIDGSKTQCNKFKLRKGLEDRLLNG